MVKEYFKNFLNFGGAEKMLRGVGRKTLS